MVATVHHTEELTPAEKKVYYCPKCKGQFDARLHRGPLVKTFLFWLPLRRYICYRCKRKFYVWR